MNTFQAMNDIEAKELINVLKEYIDIYREYKRKGSREPSSDVMTSGHYKVMRYTVAPIGKELLKIDKLMRILALEDPNYILIEVKVKVLEKEEVMKKHGKLLLRKLYISTSTQGFLISVYSDSTILVSDIEKIYSRFSITQPEIVNLTICSKTLK